MRLHHLSRSVLVIIALLIMISSELVSVHAAPFVSPAAMLTTYYNDVSLRQYDGAYALWLTPLQTYNDFVTGFATTDHVTPYLGDVQATGNNSGLIPGVLVGYHTDGSIVAYHGCFDVVDNFSATSSWQLRGANFELFANLLPDNDLISAYLNVNCSVGTTILPTNAPIPSSDQVFSNDRVNQMLTNYYELVNRRDYTNAYAEWLRPLPGPKPNGAPANDYRLPYDQFVMGYATTRFVSVYLGTFNYTGAFAGHGYVAGEFPVYLLGEHIDGTYVGFLGCYAIGGMQGLDVGIINGAFKQVSNGSDVPSLKSVLPSLKTICDEMRPNLQV